MSLLESPGYPAELAHTLDLTRTNVSNHLACLRDCGIVAAEPEGRRARYEIADPHLGQALNALVDTTLAVDENASCLDPACPGGWLQRRCGRPTIVFAACGCEAAEPSAGHEEPTPWWGDRAVIVPAASGGALLMGLTLDSFVPGSGLAAAMLFWAALVLGRRSSCREHCGDC